MSRLRANRKTRYSRQKLDARRDFRKRKGRLPSERALGTGALIGLILLTAVFLSGLALLYRVEPKTEAIEPSLARAANQELSTPPPEQPTEDENTPRSQFANSPAIAATFDHCGAIRRTCVVDGDTFWLKGTKIRIADIDTPEISQPKCRLEKALGDRATSRLIELLNIGPFELYKIGNRDADRYGRKLRVVVRDGQSLGDQLISEGLARTWTGQREPWC